MIRFFSIVIASAMLALYVFPAQAKSVGNFCSEIQSSTDLVECLDKYYEKTKISQGQAFQAQLEGLEKQYGSDLRDIQKNWVAYRNLQCNWEAKNEENQSLKRVKELYCLIRLTEQREQILDVSQSNIKDQQEHHGVTPRWENVLTENFSEIYWRRSNHLKSDLNCNEQLENTIMGVRISDEGLAQYVVGFIEETETGRPEALLYDLPITEAQKEEESVQCGIVANFELIENPVEDMQDCNSAVIKITNGSCAEHEIIWNEEKFEIQPRVKETTEKVEQ